MSHDGDKALREKLAPYAKPSFPKSTFQLCNSLLLFIGTWILMLFCLQYSYLLTLVSAFPAAGFLVRLFIIQHDCGHASFFASRVANNALGFMLGILTLTPYGYWRRTHALHHKDSGKLEYRNFGEIYLLTVDEYHARSRWGRLRYRLYRHPLILLGLGPIYQFFVKHRLPIDMPCSWRREWHSVHFTNLGIVVLSLAIVCLVGFKAYFLIQVPITLIAGVIGVWMFYVQHNFEDTYWRRRPEWTFDAAGLQGASFYDLPRWLHWFTGNIGVHHVHHLMFRIPNYNLMKAFRELRELHGVTRLKFWESLRCLNYKLWDEGRRKLVSFREARLSRKRMTALAS